MVVGEFNHIRLTDVLPRSHQHMDFPSRGNNTLYCVYSNICGAYRAQPRPHLGLSDHISVWVLRDCAHQLSVLTDIFNTSLLEACVPACLKAATIIPVPKSSKVTGLNDYGPVALTPIVMKCFERLVLAHIKGSIDATLDPHQYAYRKNRSTDNAISSVVHTAVTHLENRNAYVRVLFLVSSAFNTIIPQKLVGKLSALGLSR